MLTTKTLNLGHVRSAVSIRDSSQVSIQSGQQDHEVGALGHD